MSYCRWSSMDFQCDLYVYESVHDCWTLHVAGRRRILPEGYPRTSDFVTATDEKWVEQWIACREAQEEFDAKHYPTVDDQLDQSDHYEWIDLSEVSPKYAGESFDVATPGEAADLLEDMKSEGLQFPESIIEELRKEQAELPA